MWVTFDGILLTHWKWENDCAIRSGRLCVIILGSDICYWARKRNTHLETKQNHWVGSLTCDQLPDLQVCGLTKQPHQRWDAATVFQGNLVIIVSLPIHQVPQRPTGTAVDFRHPVIQQVHQELDASLSPYLKEQGNSFGLRESSSTVWVQAPLPSENPLSTTARAELGSGRGKKTTEHSSWIPSWAATLISHQQGAKCTAFEWQNLGNMILTS